MQHISQQAIVQYPAIDLYRLVDDIPSYPDFLPWCDSAIEHARHEDSVEATIMLKKGPISQAFTTRNVNSSDPCHRIEMNLLEGPFSDLYGVWLFKPLHADACKVSLEMEFAISNPLLRVTLEPVFTQVLSRLVDAFKARAEEIYG